VTCPHCDAKAKLPQYVLEATLRCRRCSRVFTAKGPGGPEPEPPPVLHLPAPEAPAAEPPAEAPAPDRPAPLLTEPHRCQHCSAPVDAPAGQTRATITCAACGNKTSVYAVLHTCSECGRLLESPSSSAGQLTSCPGCGARPQVPRDVLLTEAPTYSNEFWFGIDCPGCGAGLVTRPQDAGAYAVCPRCFVAFHVPRQGRYLEGRPPAGAADPLASLHSDRDVTCPRCQTRFPARAPACPACGAPAPPPAPG
jgi:hypothetical protein